MEYVLGNLSALKFSPGKFYNPVKFLIARVWDHFIPHPRNNYYPHILGHRLMGLFSVLLVAIKIFTFAVLSFGPILPALSSAITPANIISLTNESRKIFNLPALSENEALTKAAQDKAEDMLKKGYFSHTSPDGRLPWDFIQSVGYNYLVAGENLAVNFIEAEDIKTAWMNSPTHKANILNKNFEEIGIGITQGEYQGHQAIFVAQMFGAPIEQKVNITQMPTVVQIEPIPKPQAKDGVLKDNPLSIRNTQLGVKDNMVEISATIDGNAVKVLAKFGQKAIMLEPKQKNLWQGKIALNKLTTGNLQMQIQAIAMDGSSKIEQLADFSNNTASNFNVLGISTNEPETNFFGKIINLKQIEKRVYLWFAVLIMACMVLAIGIHKRIQHVSLIANASFVVILAMLFWLGG